MVNWKTGLLLLAVLVGLGAYAYSSRPQPKPPGPAFIPCGLLETTSIEIRGGQRNLLLERPSPAEPWQVRQPVAGPGDPQKVADLVGAIDSVKVLNTIGRPQADAYYGLTAPREIVTCRVTSGSSFTLSIGSQSFDGSGYYAHKGGDSRVYVISSVEVDSFERALTGPPVQATPSPSPGG